MDKFIWWIWVAAQIIILIVSIRCFVWFCFWFIDKVFGVYISCNGLKFMGIEEVKIRTNTLDLELTNVYFYLRWYDKSCRRFIRLNVDQLEGQYSFNKDESQRKSHEQSHDIGMKRRALYKMLRWLSKICEVVINKIDISVQDVKSHNIGYLDLVHISEGVELNIETHPLQVLVISFAINKLNYNSFLCLSTENAATIDDNLFSLLDGSVNCRGLIFLNLLSSSDIIDSIQMTVSSLKGQLQSATISHVLRRFKPISSNDTNTTSSLNKLPKRIEVLFEDINISYKTDGGQRIIHCGLDKLSVDIENSSSSSPVQITTVIRGLYLKPHLSKDIIGLQQLHSISKLDDEILSITVRMTSLKSHFNDVELYYWYRQLQNIFTTSFPKDATQIKLLPSLYILPVAIVTTVEVSDWLFNIQLNGRVYTEPTCQLVIANGVLKTSLSNLQEDSRVLRMSGHLDNTYLHVPGSGHMTTSRDNPSILPLLCLHHTGRIISIGSMTMSISTSIGLQDSVQNVMGTRTIANYSLDIKGSGQSIMIEWSKSILDSIINTLAYCNNEYKILSLIKASSNQPVRNNAPVISININGLNVFLIGTDVSLMTRVDSLSITPSPITLTLYRLALDEITLPSKGFQCVPIASLPHGILDITNLTLQYDNDLRISCANVLMNWSTQIHCSTSYCIDMILNHIRIINSSIQQMKSFIPLIIKDHNYQTQDLGLMGENMMKLLRRIVFDIHLELEEGMCHFSLDKTSSTRVSLKTQTSHCTLRNSDFSVDIYQLGILCDSHPILTFDGLQIQFPHPKDNKNQRERFPQLIVKDNYTLHIFTSRVELFFPNEYKFYSTYEKLTDIRKFISTYHQKNSGHNHHVIPLDIVLEVDETLFQIEDNLMDVKLRANYELMCDEQEQRQQRLESLDSKLDEIKKSQGRLFSVRRVQNLYESLVETNDNIYCQRVKEMYASEPLKTQLFSVNLQQTYLLIISDTTMLGRDNLMIHLQDMDNLSSLPDNYQFSTLWGAYVVFTTEHVEAQIRDYPWKLLEGDNLNVFGRLVFAEQEAEERECYSVPVHVGSPWRDCEIIRKLPPLKYYHDLDIYADTLEWTWGPCLDPAFSQMNYSFNFITKPPLDPSPPLSWWDKCRLLIHGKANIETPQISGYLLASTDPYNTSEYLEMRFVDLNCNLTDNASLILEGEFQMYVHTASRYDVCQVMSLPSVKLELSYRFLCKGEDSYTHHYVVRCVSTKLPIIAEGQEHDSYALFRSHNMDVNINLSLQKDNDNIIPEITLYASTLRWLQKWIDFVRSQISRPIRRGKVHNNVRPKKRRFTRQLRNIEMSVDIPNTVIQYWSSVRQHQGLEFQIQSAVFHVGYRLKLIPHSDGLIRRPEADWAISTCDGKLLELTVYTCIRDQEQVDVLSTVGGDEYVIGNPCVLDEDCKTILEKRIVLTMSQLSYIRQNTSTDNTGDFKHQLKTSNTRIVWSEISRDVIYKIIDSYKLYQRLKRDLSAEALQSIITKLDNTTVVDTKDTPVHEVEHTVEETSERHPHFHRHNSGCAMLDQLLSDTLNILVTSEENREPSDPKLKGIVDAKSKVKEHNWLIELTNTQVALQGVEKTGYVVCSSYIAQVFGRELEPQWTEGDLVTRNSWVAKVQDLQYFCTMETDYLEYIPWLPLSVMQPPGIHDMTHSPEDEESLTAVLLRQLGPDLAHPVGVQEMMSFKLPGEAVGGQVTSVPMLGFTIEGISQSPSTPPPNGALQLQRIASRCHCQFFYIAFGDTVTDCPNLPSSGEKGFTPVNEAVDTFTFRYPSAEVCTTSSQYRLIMDIVNKLLLYKEPRTKETTEQHARLKFMLQLSAISDIRKPILAKQNKIRQILSILRAIENELYIQQKSGTTGSSRSELEQQLVCSKKELSQASVELRAMIRAFKEKQFYTTPQNSEGETISPEPSRRIEVWLDDAQWSLMQEDGQLQIAEVRFTNFSYNRISFTDDSGEHRFELGSFRVKNCMPNTSNIYKEVLSPYDPASRRLRVDKNVSLRIYCRDQSPVAGIPVTEHLELNVVPLAVRLTEKFYNTLQEFFLPRAEAEARELTSDPDHSHVFGGIQPTYHMTSTDITDGANFSRGSSTRRSVFSITSNTSAMTNNSVHSPPQSPSVKEGRRGNRRSTVQNIDDVEKMKERASNIKTFIYVKIPQTTLCITYRGEGISVKEIHDQVVTIPTLEYHNTNWSWRALLLEIKKDYKNTIIAQILKSAIGIKETDEKAGLSSPKLGRSTSDILMGKIKEGKAKSKRLFTHKHEEEEDESSSRQIHDSSPDYIPPLSDPQRRKYKLHSESQKN